VLVLRKITERQESLDYGLSKLSGLDAASIYSNTHLLLNDPLELAAMLRAIGQHPNIYGDGSASKRITKHCLDFLLAGKPHEQQSPLPCQ
jgi:UDP-N-acetylglucosamine 2-epimerase (non-hydrolysing)